MAKTRQHLIVLFILSIPQLLQGTCGLGKYTRHADNEIPSRKTTSERTIGATNEYDEYVDYVNQDNEGTEVYSAKYKEDCSENEDNYRRGRFHNENYKRNGGGNFAVDRGVVFILENRTCNFTRNNDDSGNNIRLKKLGKNHNDVTMKGLGVHRKIIDDSRINSNMVGRMVQESHKFENKENLRTPRRKNDVGNNIRDQFLHTNDNEGNMKRNKKELGVHRKGTHGSGKNRIMVGKIDQKSDEIEIKRNFRSRNYDNGDSIRDENVDRNNYKDGNIERNKESRDVIHRKSAGSRKNRFMAGKKDQKGDVLETRNKGYFRDTNNQGTGVENIARQAKSEMQTNDDTDQLCSPSNTMIIVSKCPGKREHKNMYQNCSTIFLLNEENPCSFFMCSPSQNVRIFMEPQLMHCPPDTYFDTELMRCERLIDAEVYIVCPNTTAPLK